MKKSIKWMTNIALFSAFAAVISYIEMLIPLNLGIPGVKPGLANFVIIITLYEFGAREALYVNILRILILGLLSGNVFSILFSISGALISLAVMTIIKNIKGFSLIGASIAGAVSHNIGQLIIAAFVVNTYSIVYYIPVLIISGIITGLIIGVLSHTIRPIIHKIISLRKDEI